jgi:hypothetical protein
MMTLFYSPENMWKSEYTLRFTNLKTPSTFDEFERMLHKIFRPIGSTYPDQFDFIEDRSSVETNELDGVQSLIGNFYT